MKNKFIKFGVSIIAISLIFAYSFLNSEQTNTNNIQASTLELSKKPYFNRYPKKLVYSKHALCRMDCRKIDESEVKEILEKGKINFNKSQFKNVEKCRIKYALEGITRDNQRVRIVFSPCDDETTVVTVIDLETDWVCDC